MRLPDSILSAHCSVWDIRRSVHCDLIQRVGLVAAATLILAPGTMRPRIGRGVRRPKFHSPIFGFGRRAMTTSKVREADGRVPSCLPEIASVV